MSQEQFLSNDANKKRLIFFLREMLENENFIVKQSIEDVDTLIVRSTIEIANSAECVFMVGEDTDLLVLLTALSLSSCKNIYFLKPGKGKLDHLCYSAENFKYSKHVRKGKIQFVKLLDKTKELQDIVSIFLDDNANGNDIDDAGQLFITTLDADNCVEMLDKLRYQLFSKSLMKKSLF